ncbi:MAG: methionyl-tRNA formyltransferase [Beijerinckiaceae bacterium]
MRVVFMGTPDFAVPVLAAIAEQHEIVAVYSRAPAKSGRGMQLRPSPVHALAEQLKIPVFTPATLKTPEAQTLFASHEADVAVVVAYGMLLPKAILEVPVDGCLNLHGSLLPRWRGAAPIHRAVMAGDTQTGVMVMRMDEGLDTGPVAMVERTAIGPDETTGDLHDRLKNLGADLMVRALAALARGSLTFTPQGSDGITYAKKILNDEARIDFSASHTTVHNLVRGLSPFPGAFFEADLGKGLERVKVLKSAPAGAAQAAPGTVLDTHLTIACGDGAVRLITVQRAGSKPMDAAAFLNGTWLVPGTVL